LPPWKRKSDHASKAQAKAHLKMKWMHNLLSEKGTVSAIRVCMVVWFAVFILTWLMVALARPGIPEIPASVVTFSGMMLGAKVWQKSQEQKP
jgi:hypothetical protein